MSEENRAQTESESKFYLDCLEASGGCLFFSVLLTVAAVWGTITGYNYTSGHVSPLWLAPLLPWITGAITLVLLAIFIWAFRRWRAEPLPTAPSASLPVQTTPKPATAKQQTSVAVKSTSAEKKDETAIRAIAEAGRLAREAERIAREKAEEERLRKAEEEIERLRVAREEQAKAERLSQQHPLTQLPTTPEPLRKDLLHCTRCNTVYEEGDAFCKKCGSALTAPGTKTELATQTMTCPNCATTVPNDSTFCPKCGSMMSLRGTTDATVRVQTPVPPTVLKNSAMVNTQAETVAATTMSHLCPSCHTTIQRGPEDRFCGNCGHAFV